MTDDWRTHAACKGLDPAIFFPEHGGAHQATKAKQLCAACPVRERCLADHVDETEGIWGGTSELDRRAIRRAKGIKRRTAPRDYAPCGTSAAYRRHQRNGETPCDTCAQANAARKRERDDRARQKPPCGTTAAYQRHVKDGKTPCAACRYAAAEAQRERRTRLRQEVA